MNGNGEKDSILARIREALRIAAPIRHTEHGAHAPAEPRNYRNFLPPSGNTEKERLSLFAEQSGKLKTNFVLCTSEAEVRSRLTQLALDEQWHGIAHDSDTQAFTNNFSVPKLCTEQSYKPEDLEKCDVGISACEALIAQSGSVLITSLSSGGRSLSVLPPHHIVIAKRDQLVGDLSDGFALLRAKYGEKIPAYISFITGPSRTGDIERILVLGAHGPKKLTVFLY